MEYGKDPGWQPYNSPNLAAPGPRRANGFATTSCVLGIVSLLCVFSMTIFPAMVFGGLAILLGLLSRGSAKKPSGNALVGIVTAASALIINVTLCASSLYLYFNDAELRGQVNSMVNDTYEQMFGMDLDEILQNYGIEPGELQ